MDGGALVSRRHDPDDYEPEVWEVADAEDDALGPVGQAFREDPEFFTEDEWETLRENEDSLPAWGEGFYLAANKLVAS